ncbi:hypothetical protein BMS3Abin15_00741 [bacterium BMS3Abin15]|nr:hypothetical protein BMS3Abin15_00741 [bacterium BMS3Abin15]
MDIGSPRLKKLLIALVTILVVVLVVTVYLINKEMSKKDKLQNIPSEEKSVVDPEIIKSLTAPAPAESDAEAMEDPAENVDPEIIKSLTAPVPEVSDNPEPISSDIINSLTAPGN